MFASKKKQEKGAHKSFFQHPPVVAFRRSPNLRDLLVTAKLPSNSANPQLPCGSFRCGKNCATCPYISHLLTTYTFFSTGETRPIKFNLTRNNPQGIREW